MPINRANQSVDQFLDTSAFINPDLLGVTGGVRRQQPQQRFMLPAGFQQLGVETPKGGIDFSKLAGIGSLAAGGAAAFSAFNAITPDFDSSLTAESARELIAGQRRTGSQQIQRGVSQGI
ncbi:MAG: hypothetical protein KAS32_16265, partial [Candidatus Peribacteraceae bacterium]|nr:hypothetical protein [Candidatus Peribacteraceae bacterium]